MKIYTSNIGLKLEIVAIILAVILNKNFFVPVYPKLSFLDTWNDMAVETTSLKII